MITRFLFAVGLALLTSLQARACDCVPWEGYVSEFAKNYVSVWAVPTSANVNIENMSKPSGGVTYRLEVLEGYNRITQTNIDFTSDIADGGGSCGVQLRLGAAQFISAYDYGNQFYAISSCTPLIPYNAIKQFLETGEDSFIPSWGKCHSWPENEYDTPIFNSELEACEIWKGADHIHEYMGAKDQRKYDQIWRDKFASTKSKKKRRWWHFKKD